MRPADCHTPGPWKAQIARSGSNRLQVSAASGKQVALIWRHSPSETHANKSLILAAPDLLALANALANAGIAYVEGIDVHALILRATGASAPSSIAAINSQPDLQGYAEAFYEVAKILDVGAMPASPKIAWETVMRPKLIALAASSAP